MQCDGAMTSGADGMRLGDGMLTLPVALRPVAVAARARPCAGGFALDRDTSERLARGIQAERSSPFILGARARNRYRSLAERDRSLAVARPLARARLLLSRRPRA